MKNFLIKIISTFFYVGYLPLTPGTFASGACCLIIWLLKDNPFIYLVFTASVTILGFLTAGVAEGLFKKKDAGYIVIDEVAGMSLSLLFLPVNSVTLFCAFVLFRGFDAFKIYPADKLQHCRGSKGVMLDDIIAGFYTNLILQFVLRFTSCSAA
jgi:phosphatidylglycerophosphatase A